MSALTFEQLIEIARPLAAWPRPARIEFGSDAFARLKAHLQPEVQPEVHEAGYVPPPVSGAMYGVPMAVPEGDEALDPDAWRLLGTDGRVIKEGIL